MCLKTLRNYSHIIHMCSYYSFRFLLLLLLCLITANFISMSVMSASRYWARVQGQVTLLLASTSTMTDLWPPYVVKARSAPSLSISRGRHAPLCLPAADRWPQNDRLTDWIAGRGHWQSCVIPAQRRLAVFYSCHSIGRLCNFYR